MSMLGVGLRRGLRELFLLFLCSSMSLIASVWFDAFDCVGVDEYAGSGITEKLA